MGPVLYVLSGAGLSVESGIDTFRTAGGTWSKHDLKVVCNYLTWKQNRAAVFEFYSERRKNAGAASSNAAHLRLAEWQKRYGKDRVKLLTQNVDGLLEQAGATAVTHLHGDLLHLHCTACSTRWRVLDEEYHESTRCVKCGSLKGVKPGVVFFNENAPEYAHIRRLTKTIRSEDIFLVIGTSMEVLSARDILPRGRWYSLNWQVNPEPAELECFGVNVRKVASAGLEELEPRLIAAMEPA